MEEKVKYNDSTKLRPEGERVLNAPLVHMDLKEYIKTIRSEKLYQERDVSSMTIYKSETVRLVLMALHKNAVIKRHIANGTITVQVLDGEIQFSTDDQELILKEHDTIALHKLIPHEVKAVKESVFLLSLFVADKDPQPSGVRE